MKTEMQTEVAGDIGASMETAVPAVDSNPRWTLATRISFRFAFVYGGLFTLTFPAGFFIPYTTWLPHRFWNKTVPWFAAHIIHFSKPVSTEFTGSGDGLFGWMEVLLIFLMAVLATAIWSVLDRRRKNYVTLHKWFRLWVRFSLITTMMSYGASKAIPNQMSTPYLMDLLEPYGNALLMGILWTSIGASKAYTIFAGCAEILGGLLLIFPRTALADGLVSAAVMTQVFMLNMCYDVPVKIFSFHCILLALFIVASDVPRLVNMFFLHRTVKPPSMPPLFRRPWANWTAVILQVVIGSYILGSDLMGEAKMHKEIFATPKSPLYGIWDVDVFSIDGQVQPPLLTDQQRWHRVILDYANTLAIQKMSDSLVEPFYGKEHFRGYSMNLDLPNHKFTLGKSNTKDTYDFTLERPSPEKMIWDGTLEGHKIHAELQQVDMANLPLISRGFHWVQENPFNR